MIKDIIEIVRDVGIWLIVTILSLLLIIIFVFDMVAKKYDDFRDIR